MTNEQLLRLWRCIALFVVKRSLVIGGVRLMERHEKTANANNIGLKATLDVDLFEIQVQQTIRESAIKCSIQSRYDIYSTLLVLRVLNCSLAHKFSCCPEVH
jgi:hypothetical protein